MLHLIISFALIGLPPLGEEALPAAPVDLEIGRQAVELRKPLVVRMEGARLILFVRDLSGLNIAGHGARDALEWAVPTGSVSAYLTGADVRHEITVDGRAEGSPDPLREDQVLDRDRQAIERLVADVFTLLIEGFRGVPGCLGIQADDGIDLRVDGLDTCQRHVHELGDSKLAPLDRGRSSAADR